MATEITTPYGHAPDDAPHSVIFHMPGWALVERFIPDKVKLIAGLYNAYPRIKIHRDIDKLARAVLTLLGLENRACFLFYTLHSAKDCVEYSTSSRRDNGIDKHPVDPEQISIYALQAKDRFYAVVFPLEFRPVVFGYWYNIGCGVSSRFAEANLAVLDQLREIKLGAETTKTLTLDVINDEDRRNPMFESPSHQRIRERIVYYLNRAPLHPEVTSQLTADDVYLFQSGMSTIYRPHSYLGSMDDGTTVLFGMAFFNTISVFQEFGSGGFKFFGNSTDKDVRDLELFLEEEYRNGRKVKAIWVEFPSNPLLVTPDLCQLRLLADRYDIILFVDDTLGSFANLDVMSVADVQVTSLTKSFNGYADAMAGSVVLNRASRKYDLLKALFEQRYVPELYIDDAKVIERNSRDYLVRSARLNHNALSIVNYLQSCVEDPNSAVVRVYHPSLPSPLGQHFREFMRPATTTDSSSSSTPFAPGFGCLFTVELESLTCTAAFYDNLHIHLGPHLGAPVTLGFAYTMCQYGDKLEWAAQYGLRPTQIRMSAGLEDDTDKLVATVRVAVEAANRVKRGCEPSAVTTNALYH